MEHNATPDNPKESQKVLTWEEHARALWDLLDNIDTHDDLAKENEKLYRNLVRKEHYKRFSYGKSDGYDVEFEIKKENK